jgi:hypothetical protein
MTDPVYTTYEPFPEGRTGTCIVKDCTQPARWTAHLSRPIVGWPMLALCDIHLYDFETSTVTPHDP